MTIARFKATEMQYGFDPINNNWSPNQDLQHAPNMERPNQYNQPTIILGIGIWGSDSK